MPRKCRLGYQEKHDLTFHRISYNVEPYGQCFVQIVFVDIINFKGLPNEVAEANIVFLMSKLLYKTPCQFFTIIFAKESC